jgi:hypothetical protein
LLDGPRIATSRTLLDAVGALLRAEITASDVRFWPALRTLSLPLGGLDVGHGDGGRGDGGKVEVLEALSRALESNRTLTSLELDHLVPTTLAPHKSRTPARDPPLASQTAQRQPCAVARPPLGASNAQRKSLSLDQLGEADGLAQPSMLEVRTACAEDAAWAAICAILRTNAIGHRMHGGRGPVELAGTAAASAFREAPSRVNISPRSIALEAAARFLTTPAPSRGAATRRALHSAGVASAEAARRARAVVAAGERDGWAELLAACTNPAGGCRRMS